MMALSSPSRPLSFLDLPAEIRAMIYVLAFEDLQITVYSRNACIQGLPSFGFREALLLRSTSRAIQAEVVSYISAHTTLVLKDISAPQILSTIIPQQYLNNIKCVIASGHCGREIRINHTELPSLKFVEIHNGLYISSTYSLSDEAVVLIALKTLTDAWCPYHGSDKSSLNVHETYPRPFELVCLVELEVISSGITYKVCKNKDIFVVH